MIQLLPLLALVGCFGGGTTPVHRRDMTIDIECDLKVLNISWDGPNLWYAARPMKAEDKPETLYFYERPQYGPRRGEVVLVESRCKKTP